jgi:hypothetical protein
MTARMRRIWEHNFIIHGLIMLIAIMGWKESKYVFFSTRPKPNHGARYLSLGAVSDIRKRKMNTTIFEGYLHDLQETIANLWRITL